MASSRFIASIANAKSWITALAAGLVLSIPFWQVQAGWAVVGATALYIWWLDSKPTTRQIWLSGLSFFAVVLSWVYHIHATELIPSNFLAIIFLLLTFSIIVGGLSLGFLLFGWLWHKLDINLRDPRSLLILPALWALCEWARSLIFSVIALGPGGSIGPYWNFGSLAFAAAVTPLGYSSRLAGQFGLSALVVLAGLGMVMLLRRQFVWAGLALATVASLSLTGWLLISSPQGNNLRVGVLQLDDSPYSDYGYQRDLQQLSASHNPSQPLDILVLPEYSYIFAQKEYKNAEQAAMSRFFANNSSGLVITSQSGKAEQGRKNLVTIFNPSGQVVAEQEKQFLIPGGEYIPYFYEWILVLSGNTSVIRTHQEEHSLATSKLAAQPLSYAQDRVGALACSGAIAPGFYRNLVAGGATVLTNSAALSTMGLSSSYYAQSQQMARFIAMANARPFIQSARGAEVFVLDKNGRLVAESHKPGVHYLETEVKSNQARTPYSRMGDAWILIAMGVLLTLSIKGVDKLS